MALAGRARPAMLEVQLVNSVRPHLVSTRKGALQRVPIRADKTNSQTLLRLGGANFLGITRTGQAPAHEHGPRPRLNMAEPSPSAPDYGGSTGTFIERGVATGLGHGTRSESSSPSASTATRDFQPRLDIVGPARRRIADPFFDGLLTGEATAFGKFFKDFTKADAVVSLTASALCAKAAFCQLPGECRKIRNRSQLRFGPKSGIPRPTILDGRCASTNCWLVKGGGAVGPTRWLILQHTCGLELHLIVKRAGRAAAQNRDCLTTAAQVARASRTFCSGLSRPSASAQGKSSKSGRLTPSPRGRSLSNRTARHLSARPGSQRGRIRQFSDALKARSGPGSSGRAENKKVDPFSPSVSEHCRG